MPHAAPATEAALRDSTAAGPPRLWQQMPLPPGDPDYKMRLVVLHNAASIRRHGVSCTAPAEVPT